MSAGHSLVADRTDGEGDCYDVAATYVTDHRGGTGLSEPVLVHATVLGTGGEALGIRYGHAWVEVEAFGNRLVIDKSNGHDTVVPAQRYYEAGQAEGIVRYSRRRTLQLLLKHMHYGPWPDEPGDA